MAIRYRTKFTLYKLWKGRKMNVKYFHIFVVSATSRIIINKKINIDAKSEVGIFLGYSINRRAYKSATHILRQWWSS